MTNQNGQLILQTLQNFSEPATITKIVTLIAESAGVHPRDVKDSVQETLNGGVRYGYIQRANRKYYATPVDLEALAPGSVNEETNREDGSGERAAENMADDDEDDDGAEVGTLGLDGEKFDDLDIPNDYSGDLDECNKQRRRQAPRKCRRRTKRRRRCRYRH